MQKIYNINNIQKYNIYFKIYNIKHILTNILIIIDKDPNH